MGVTVNEGHNARNVGEAHVVVKSAAIRADILKIVEAQARSIPRYSPR